jgi:hypothetical protein
MVRVLASSIKCYVFNIRFGLNKDYNRDIQVSAYYSFSPTRSISGAVNLSLGLVASLLSATLYQGNADRIHKL